LKPVKLALMTIGAVMIRALRAEPLGVLNAAIHAMRQQKRDAKICPQRQTPKSAPSSSVCDTQTETHAVNARVRAHSG
jgi:hypothetical protein